MNRMTPFSSPLLLGFDGVERMLERMGKASDGYPPFNIERIRAPGEREGAARDGTGGEPAIRITLAVAGFQTEDLEITTEDNQLTIRGSQSDREERDFLHRGIAARQFQKSFLFADGMRILGAQLKNGLLMIDLVKPEPERVVKKIEITVED
ncbi:MULTISPECIES: Hsp20 family protein [Aureimonas]|uniref:HSP20 family molecular chaperone IbpA n=1 Tax=Aureimonas phyllosphaerae TaxID=1166078 RepID=A0A7W6FWW5_9HYPH|nr:MULTISPECIES: Hsp20 family protein [Aureimonas]KQQ78909.1 heat-shock protein Hsp20 [Aureimonas sp. Leaf324]MBB3937442.1 HSP20 family molecular chaperone IbpA [Aureimonas phyllosphaerae]MBB3961492.1 HSP20 family molecular chaperone IbpA [Aureimonas phyllosphaerae]SFF38690.1 Molecular chaperone IbpA, HSP20 family [Aureimonas phyllosphaerae]